MKKETIYEAPYITEIELIPEQAVLAASGGDYPAFLEEEDWSN